MKTQKTHNGLIHTSSCGQYQTEQETKNFFYIIDVLHDYTIGQIDIQDKEFRFSDSNSWYKNTELQKILYFLQEIYEYYR